MLRVDIAFYRDYVIGPTRVLIHDPCPFSLPVLWEFPKIRRHNIEPQIAGLSLQGHPNKGLPIYGNPHMDPGSCRVHSGPSELLLAAWPRASQRLARLRAKFSRSFQTMV